IRISLELETIRWIEARFQRWICTAIWIPRAMPQARNGTAPLALNSSDGRENGEATRACRTFHLPKRQLTIDQHYPPVSHAAQIILDFTSRYIILSASRFVSMVTHELTFYLAAAALLVLMVESCVKLLKGDSFSITL